MEASAEEIRAHRDSLPPYSPAAKAALGTVVVLALMLFLGLLTANDAGSVGPFELTKVSVKASMGLATEYEVRIATPVDHRAPTLAMHALIARGQPVPDSWMEAFVYELSQTKSLKEGLQSLGRDSFSDSDGDGFMEILDGWGRPMIYVHSVSHKDRFLADDFLPEYKHPYIVSAGPDGNYGDVNDPQDTAHLDNVFSFSLE